MPVVLPPDFPYFPLPTELHLGVVVLLASVATPRLGAAPGAHPAVEAHPDGAEDEEEDGQDGEDADQGDLDCVQEGPGKKEARVSLGKAKKYTEAH